MDANVLDIAVLAVLLLSGLFAMMRGFVQEVLSIAAWVGAGLAALYGLPQARPFAQQYIGNKAWADAAAGGALFLITLVLLSIVTYFIAKQVKGSMLSHLDRSLGFVFGLARGALILCLAYMVAMFMFTPEQGSAKEASGAKLPMWISQAKSKPYLEHGAVTISTILPEAYDLAETKAKQARDDAETVIKFNELLSPKPRGEQPAAGQPQNTAPAYSTSDRKAMDQLYQTK